MCKIFSNMKFFLSTHLQLYILHNPFNLYLLRLFICANLSFVCYEFLLYTFFCSYLTQQSVANPQTVPDCGPGFISATAAHAPAGAALRLAPERGKRRRDWLRASPSARAENRLRASPAAQGKRQASPVGGVSPSFCCHSFHLIHPLFLAAPTFRLVELAGCGNGLLSCFLSGPGRIPHGLSAS